MRSLADHLKRHVRRRRDLAALTTWDSKDRDRREVYLKFAGREDVVFDVGANVGNRAKVFAKLARKTVLFEPQPYCLAILKAGFGDMKNVEIVPKAVGSAPGRATMKVSDAHTISSMSPAWIDAVRASGRFDAQNWDREIEVDVITLDQAVAEHGRPSFVKIDVEGFEAEVLRGLSSAVAALSFEFTPEHTGGLAACLDHITSLGVYEFNLSLGESMALESADWFDADEALRRVTAYDTTVFGDVYARLRSRPPSA